MNLYAISAVVLGFVSVGLVDPAPTAPAPLPAAFHCQVPCGVYGDSMRIAMINEDLDTIAKGMMQITEMENAESFPHNQMVRWVMNKDEHASKIQEQVASYWLAQRIKKPKDRDGRDEYIKQLELMHGMTIAAMKCKQTTDTANVDKLREFAKAFSRSYFSEEDLEHMKEHARK